MSCSYTQAFHTLEFRHGPKSVVSRETLIVFLLSLSNYAAEADVLQEIKERLPGREWKVTRTPSTHVTTLGALLRETEEHHGQYEKTHAKHNWWDWYAPYLSARQNGSSPEEAAAAADRRMEEALQALPR